MVIEWSFPHEYERNPPTTKIRKGNRKGRGSRIRKMTRLQTVYLMYCTTVVVLLVVQLQDKTENILSVVTGEY